MLDARIRHWTRRAGGPGGGGGWEACWFAPARARIGGVAQWEAHGDKISAGYEIDFDPESRVTRRAVVLTEGRSLTIARHPASGAWSLNDCAVPGLEAALDIDLGFSPSTNTLPILRLDLAEGQSADLVAAWLDPADWTLKPLPQRYTRLGPELWRYESRGGSFSADLTVTAEGLVRDYGTIWREA